MSDHSTSIKDSNKSLKSVEKLQKNVTFQPNKKVELKGEEDGN